MEILSVPWQCVDNVGTFKQISSVVPRQCANFSVIFRHALKKIRVLLGL